MCRCLGFRVVPIFTAALRGDGGSNVGSSVVAGVIRVASIGGCVVSNGGSSEQSVCNDVLSTVSLLLASCELFACAGLNP